MPALKRGGFIASLLFIGMIADGIMLLVSLRSNKPIVNK